MQVSKVWWNNLDYDIKKQICEQYTYIVGKNRLPETLINSDISELFKSLIGGMYEQVYSNC